MSAAASSSAAQPVELKGGSTFLAAEATYFWTIEKFSALENKVGVFTNSPTFSVLDNSWRMSLYPGGDREEFSGHVGIFVYNQGEKPMKVNFTFAVVDSKGAELSRTQSYEREFVPIGHEGWGVPKLLARADVLDASKRYLENDTLRIKLTLEVNRLKLGKALASLVDNPALSDVKLVVNGTEIAAHRAILAARSEYFAGMFAHKMKESSEGVVRIDDEIPVSVFRQMLRFIYTDEVDWKATVEQDQSRAETKDKDMDKDMAGGLDSSEPPAPASAGSSSAAASGKEDKAPAGNNRKRKRAGVVLDMISQLLAAADRFQVADLKAICTIRLCDGLTAKNAAERLLLADRHSAPDLKKKVLEFIHADKTRLAEVMDSEAYREFKISLMHDLLAATLPIAASTRDKASLIKADVPNLSFAELRAELASRGLETGGLKEELVERLQNSLAL